MPNFILKSFVHDTLFHVASTLILTHDPCHIVPGKYATCVGWRPCCDGCRHLTVKGCSVKCLSCRLFLCWKAEANMPKMVMETIYHMRRVNHKLYLSRMRESKKDHFPALRKMLGKRAGGGF